MCSEYSNSNIIEKIQRAYQEGGLTTLFLRGWRKTKRRLFKFHASYWYVRKLQDLDEQVIPKIKVQVELGSLVETIKWEEKNVHNGTLFSEDYKEIKTAEENDHYFFNVKYDNKIIGFLKVAVRGVYIKDYMSIIKIPNRKAFIYDTYIRETYRGMEIGPYLLQEASKELLKMGIDYLFCHIKPDNSASQRAYQKVQFKKIGFIIHIRFLGLNFYNTLPEKLVKNTNTGNI